MHTYSTLMCTAHALPCMLVQHMQACRHHNMHAHQAPGLRGVLPVAWAVPQFPKLGLGAGCTWQEHATLVTHTLHKAGHAALHTQQQVAQAALDTCSQVNLHTYTTTPPLTATHCLLWHNHVHMHVQTHTCIATECPPYCMQKKESHMTYCVHTHELHTPLTHMNYTGCLQIQSWTHTCMHSYTHMHNWRLSALQTVAVDRFWVTQLPLMHTQMLTP